MTDLAASLSMLVGHIYIYFFGGGTREMYVRARNPALLAHQVYNNEILVFSASYVHSISFNNSLTIILHSTQGNKGNPRANGPKTI